MSAMTDDSIAMMLKESADSFLSGLSPVSRLALGDDPIRLVDRAVWSSMAELGWTAVLLDEGLGGSGLGLEEAAVLAEIMGEKLLGEPFVACCVMPAVVLNDCSRTDTATHIAGQLARGERLVTLAWQEQENQSAPGLPETVLRDGRISGVKRFVSGCEDDSVLLVLVQTGGEVALVAVDAGSVGVCIERFGAGVGSQAHVHFDSVEPVAGTPLLIGEAARQTLDKALLAGRIVLSAELCGYASGCLAKTLDFVGQRHQFGRPIASFQSIQHRCVDLDIECRLGRAAWQHAVACFSESTTDTRTLAAASSAKARCADAAVKVALQSVHMHGAMGFSEETGVGLYLRAALFAAGWLGGAREHRRRFQNASGAVAAVDKRPLLAGIAADTTDLDALSDDGFRLYLRQWIADNYPAHLRQDDQRPFLRLRGDDMTNWLKLLNDNGLRAPAWPKAYGGMGLSFARQLIYQQEMERAGVGRIIDTGETQLGPTLMTWGTDEQKAYYMPRILDCTDVWSQGYSEPGSGSDLASLKTRADLQGDEFVVNGQKIWTTHATDATHVFALVRTGRFEKKQQGISFLLIDLKSPGISIRPIRNIAAEEEFCEVFFDDVRVPVGNLVGKLHEGWSVAKSLLGHERIWLGSSAMAWSALALAERLLQALGLTDDRGVMDRFAQLQADLQDYRQLYGQMCDHIASGDGEPGPESSILKVYISELLQRITEFNADIAGEYGGVVGSFDLEGLTVDLHWALMMARPVSIYAGTNEVQRDILAKNLLKMPGVPKA
ncbi:acyl-CoA dehydrogenase [Pseudomonas sp. WN033]|nr:acyl-CoA dehydrogenase [Pseudomonas sp. WN033]